MNRNIASDEKWVFEVRNGVLLIFGERTELADGWWFSTNSEPFGPFNTDQEALDAAAVASDATAELNIVLILRRRCRLRTRSRSSRAPPMSRCSSGSTSASNSPTAASRSRA